ncbi:hypothetical protein [Azospirillum picis]|uniref:Uncharacterized protein n=1 Tax=Azospirillum picis TaxID=488438 RepID=A0ABU0MRZ6_9PROT|nr:hypothetical protein [Azospirillum picis]MBP2302562.1 hypothetical protein [Azospirillum picis]MDQ0536196.1 hypothetical protein [Azospirillum picis]
MSRNRLNNHPNDATQLLRLALFAHSADGNGLASMCAAFSAAHNPSDQAMNDHLIRPMGAATLRIARDTQAGRVAVAIVCASGRCHGIDSVPDDVAGTLALEASAQHFATPAAAWLWAAGRIGELTNH